MEGSYLCSVGIVRYVLNYAREDFANDESTLFRQPAPSNSEERTHRSQGHTRSGNARVQIPEVCCQERAGLLLTLPQAVELTAQSSPARSEPLKCGRTLAYCDRKRQGSMQLDNCGCSELGASEGVFLSEDPAEPN